MSGGNNPYGVNQFGEAHTHYGAAKKMKQLAEEAPMSGAPIASSALNAPQRDRRKPDSTQALFPLASAVAPPRPQMVAPTNPDDVNAMIASLPGASDLVRTIFGGGAVASGETQA